MRIGRRNCIFLLGSGSIAATAALKGTYAKSVSSSQGPPFWLATRGKDRVFLMGLSDAKDMTWFTPLIQGAFRESSELWLETPYPGAPANQDLASQQAAAAVIENLRHETGRTLFDVLEPPVRQRTLAYLEELGITKESIETLRPWAAYYVINSAFWAHWSNSKPEDNQGYVPASLGKMAQEAGMSIRYESPNREAFARSMAAMSDKAQSQYVEWLLNYFDDQKKGLNSGADTSWIRGRPADVQLRNLNRMRTRMPDLYEAIQVQRNVWWAKKIDELLATNGTYFIGIGLLHVLGPDSIPRQLQRLKVVGPADLHENPRIEMLG
jgi:uncharacterized protein YbaP (TraB family)